jgi:hypothetical protein
MPEGPSIVILKEQAAAFVGKRVVAAEGNTKLDLTRLVARSWPPSTATASISCWPSTVSRCASTC